MHPGSDLRIKAMARKLFSFFTGASADVKVAFDESVRQDLIRSMPFVNMSYGTLVSLYRPLVSMYPTHLRGTDIALKTLNIISTMEFLDRERYSSRNCCDKYFSWCCKLCVSVMLQSVAADDLNSNTSVEFLEP
jgi:hypothetical protein